jgi:hypothetical protein
MSRSNCVGPCIAAKAARSCPLGVRRDRVGGGDTSTNVRYASNSDRSVRYRPVELICPFEPDMPAPRAVLQVQPE